MMSTLQILKKMDFVTILSTTITKFENNNDFKITICKLVVSFMECNEPGIDKTLI
jgi:hypothetical protein